MLNPPSPEPQKYVTVQYNTQMKQSTRLFADFYELMKD